MRTKLKKTCNILIRIFIFVATYGFLYKKIFLGKDWQQQYDLLLGLLEKPMIKTILFIVISLMIVNWGLESQKWRFMIGKIERISFFRSIQAIFSGASISFFTPNRTGEYFGRAFILDKASHVEGIFITILGSMSQLLITILTGTFSMLIFIPKFMSSNAFFAGHIYSGFVVLIILFDLLLLFLMLNIQFLSVLRDKLFRHRLKKFRRHMIVFSFFRLRDMVYVLGISFIRYFVFTIQFLLLLKVFSVPIPLFDAVIIISLIFFTLTIVPTITITELGIRGSAAIYFFGIYFNNFDHMSDSILIGILSATSLLWIINLAIPAILGTFFIYRLKFFRKNSQSV